MEKKRKKETKNKSARAQMTQEMPVVDAGAMAADAEKLRAQKTAVIRVAQTLTERGLLVRTFGNVSRRADRDHFVITPSGVRYEDLTPEKIVRVNIKTLSYKGKILPSSEMSMHAAVYQVCPDAGFIIHTHQPYASCASALGEEEIYLPHNEMEEMEEIVSVPVAPYAEPGGRNLAARVTETIEAHKDCQGILLENHGVLCWGRNERQARARAETIEILCYTYLAEFCNTSLQYGISERFSSIREGGEIRYRDPGTPERIRRMHRKIYARRPDVQVILHNDTEAEHIISRRCTELKPVFDDFARVVGTVVRIPANDREANTEYIDVRGGVNAVFSPGDGAFCLGKTRAEAEACAMILNKNCIAQIALMRLGRNRSLPHMHCVRMNRSYRKDYAPLAEAYATSRQE